MENYSKQSNPDNNIEDIDSLTGKTIFDEAITEDENVAMETIYGLLKLVNFDKYKTYNWYIHHVVGGSGLSSYTVGERKRYQLQINREGGLLRLSVKVEQEDVRSQFSQFLKERFPTLN